jgi:hypothetical protein
LFEVLVSPSVARRRRCRGKCLAWPGRKTAKRQGSDIIQSTIVNDLLEADLVLADLTEHNPNVLFELGMRIHADLPVVLVRARGTGAIFDVDNMLRVEEYDPNLWTSTVKPTFMKILRPEPAAAPATPAAA